MLPTLFLEAVFPKGTVQLRQPALEGPRDSGITDPRVSVLRATHPYPVTEPDGRRQREWVKGGGRAL